MIKTKRDAYWKLIAKTFNDPEEHATDDVDTGNGIIDSFAKFSCSPKFRVSFPVHKMYTHYTSLR